MNNASLSSLENLPNLPKLRKIELDNNHLKGSYLKHLLKYTELEEIKIKANTQLEEFSDQISVLADLKNLRKLYFKNGFMFPIMRQEIFKKLPGLEILNGFDMFNNKVESEDDEEDISEEIDDYDDEEEDQDEDDDKGGQDDKKDPPVKKGIIGKRKERD